MANVKFEVVHQFEASARVVWDELIDWKGHEAWIPATKVDVGTGDSTAIGAEFTATTGFGPLALKDKMVVTECAWDEEVGSGKCEVEKVGPVLHGRAWFTVTADGSDASGRSVVNWFEDVTVPYVPQFLAPVLNRLGATGFRLGMKKLAKVLA